MSTTLTNGLKLPDKGSVDWYADMQSNYAILNGAVGTVAEHTSALAGKAPAVHTHGKADITDLFNSANTWSDTNTYSITGDVPIKITNGKDATNPSATEMKDIRFSDVNGKIIGGVRHSLESGGTTKMHLYSRSFSSDGSSNSNHGLLIINNKQTGVHEVQSESNFIPSANNSYDLGSSSYQWNNLYAKNYYYNGTAWGLDKANTWSNDQIIASTNDKCYRVKDTVYELGQTYSNGEHLGGLTIYDKNGATVGLLDIVDRSYGNTEMRIRVQQKFDPDSNNRSTNGDILFNEITIGILPNKQNFVGLHGHLWSANGLYDLGTSTNKWKTLNGINPGALSLPSSDSADYIDLSSNLSTNAEYLYTAPYDGWLCLYVNVNEFFEENAIGLYRSDTSANSHQWAKSVTAALNLYKQNRYQGSVMLPVESGKKYICYISLNANATIHSKYLFFYKNRGNV